VAAGWNSTAASTKGVRLMKKVIQWDQYIELVHFLGECLGDNVEVVLHDLTAFEHSVIAIHNGHITGRTVGAPLTVFALNQLKDIARQKQTEIINYKGKARNGAPLRSSSYFIRDDHGEVVGVLCINIDVSEYLKAEEIIKKLAYLPESSDESSEKGELMENFPSSISEMVTNTFTEVFAGEIIEIKRLTALEKIKIVKQLYLKGLFQIKGAVSETAAQLLTSEATIYRYLNKISKDAKRERINGQENNFIT
jgi:predicted transcriptional regulator YheO